MSFRWNDASIEDLKLLRMHPRLVARKTLRLHRARRQQRNCKNSVSTPAQATL